MSFKKDHLCSACELGKMTCATLKSKPEPSSVAPLHLLHMDLCGPMRVVSKNGKKYILVMVDDYSRYTWVHFLASKAKTPNVIIKSIKRI